MSQNIHVRRCHMCGATNEVIGDQLALTCEHCHKKLPPYFFCKVISEEGFYADGDCIDLSSRLKLIYNQLLVEDELLPKGVKPKTAYQPLVGISVLWFND